MQILIKTLTGSVAFDHTKIVRMNYDRTMDETTFILVATPQIKVKGNWQEKIIKGLKVGAVAITDKIIEYRS